MCGIWLQVLASLQNESECLIEEETANLSRRGPDHVGSAKCDYGDHEIHLKASVLKMRSNSTLQPVSIQSSDNTTRMHLAWNGEVYQVQTNGNNVKTVAGYDVADTQLVANLVSQAYSRVVEQHGNRSSNIAFMEAFANSLGSDVMGTLVNAEYAFCLVTPWAIYYGRDPWGRRSLLYRDDANSSNPGEAESSPTVWKLQSVIEQKSEASNEANLWSEVPPGIVHEYRLASKQFHSTPISKLTWAQPQLTLSTTSSDLPPDNTSSSIWKASFALEHWLRQAVQLRVCGNATQAIDSSNTTPIPIAVLFSGGIDSVVLAALALQVLPTNEPLRLWNVSFVDQHTGAPTTAQDCLAAKASFEELKQLFPQHTILLETTEVSWEEMTKCEQHIRTLIHPKSTTMDLNIAMALWFASRGRTTISDDNLEEQAEGIDQSNPRILLVGMGADEQLGGYGRHRKAYQQALENNTNGQDANECLRQELDLDIGRIWERNLGRDDRIFSDHGKEARFPYLDHHVTNFLKQTPLGDVCDYNLPPGQGDKRILRLMAMRLGLKTASGMVKRAIQFGSRISHVSDKRRFGSRRKAKGTAAV